MCRGHAFVDIRAAIGGDGLPRPFEVILPDGRRLSAAMISAEPVKTALGVESYRYELWVGGSTHIVYLQNSLPLRWFVEVDLPFSAADEAPAQLAVVAG